MPSASSNRLDPGNNAAAHRKNAAEEMSPGTAASSALSFCTPAIETESSVRVTFAPKARNANSL